LLACRHREGHSGLHQDVYDYPAKEDQSGWAIDHDMSNVWSPDRIAWGRYIDTAYASPEA
jgi:hypothetical protein